MNFEQAYHRLQEIHTLLKSEKFIDIETVQKLQEEAKKCYEYCNKALKKEEKTTSL